MDRIIRINCLESKYVIYYSIIYMITLVTIKIYYIISKKINIEYYLTHEIDNLIISYNKVIKETYLFEVR